MSEKKKKKSEYANQIQTNNTTTQDTVQKEVKNPHRREELVSCKSKAIKDKVKNSQSISCFPLGNLCSPSLIKHHNTQLSNPS